MERNTELFNLRAENKNESAGGAGRSLMSDVSHLQLENFVAWCIINNLCKRKIRLTGGSFCS